jgi:glucokinase
LKRLGIEIGGTKLQLVLGDELGNIQRRCRLRVSADSGAEGIREQITSAIPDLLQGTTLEAVGVGFGGPVDWRTGKICRSHQIEGWLGFDVGGWLHHVTGARVFVDNDANVAALAEAKLGAGAGSNPVFYVTLGSGVGGGLVTAARIYHGATPGESELGHVRLDRSGTTVESCCSGWAVDRRIRELIRTNPTSTLACLVTNAPGAEARHLATALAVGDTASQQIIAELAADLAFGLSHVVHLFHPQVIILGGGLAGVGEPLRRGVERELQGFTMSAFAPGPLIRLAALGDDVVPVGALLLAGDLTISNQQNTS